MKEALVKSEKALDKVKRQYQINQFKLQWVDNGKAGAILDKCRTSIMENKYDNLKRQLRLLMTALDDNISLSVATEKQIEEEFDEFLAEWLKLYDEEKEFYFSSFSYYFAPPK